MSFIEIPKGVSEYELCKLVAEFNKILDIPTISKEDDYDIVKKYIDYSYNINLTNEDYIYLTNLDYTNGMSYAEFQRKLDIIEPSLATYLIQVLGNRLITKELITNLLDQIVVEKDYLVKSLVSLKGTRRILDIINSNLTNTNISRLTYSENYELSISVDILEGEHTNVVDLLLSALNYLLYFINYIITIDHFIHNIRVIKYKSVDTVISSINYLVGTERI
jgi:hypothetical protein